MNNLVELSPTSEFRVPSLLLPSFLLGYLEDMLSVLLWNHKTLLPVSQQKSKIHESRRMIAIVPYSLFPSGRIPVCSERVRHP
jgi:hypothetical protein